MSGRLYDIKRNYPRNRLVIRSMQSDEIFRAFGERAERLDTDEILLRMDSPAQKQDTLRTLAETYDIDEFRVFEPSLNDIFVEYTNKEV